MQSLARFRPLSLLAAGVALAASTSTVALAQKKNKNQGPPVPSELAVQAYDGLVEAINSETYRPLRTAFARLTNNSPCAIVATQTYLHCRDTHGFDLDALQTLTKCVEGEQYKIFAQNEKDPEIRRLLNEPSYVISNRALIDRFLLGPVVADQTLEDYEKKQQKK